MDQHPIPRQITTFEFKLIGFMTLKQFLYLAIFFPIGFIVYKAVPVEILNILLGVVVGLVGVAFAFIPIQDRPMEQWIRNLIKRLNSPTQYVYKKNNNSVSFLEDLYYASDPHLAVSHVDTKEKLNKYLAAKQVQEPGAPTDQKRVKQQVHIDDLLHQTKHIDPTQIKKGQGTLKGQAANQQTQSSVKQPFVTGIIRNRRNIPLPGILVSIKDQSGQQLRLLKTNPHGIFATYSPLPEDDYSFEISDPNGNYFFDTMNVHIQPGTQNPIMFYSKEVL